jgi:cysteine-rich repeat protein
MTHQSAHRCMTLVGLVVLGATASARADAPFCPHGEITLAGARLRVVARHGGPPRLASTRGTFIEPEGVAISPASEPIVFAIEGDRKRIATTTLPAGSLGVDGKGRRFTYRADGSTLVLQHLRGTHRLRARFADVDLSALDLGQPPQFVKQILKVGDDCFAAVLTCIPRKGGLACAPERTALLAGRVEGARHEPLAGAMLTAFDDAHLETVSVFAQADGHFAFPLLRPGAYRLRARLIGYDDVVRTHVVLADDDVTRVDVTMTPTADTNAQLPASAWFSLLLDKWPDPKIRSDFTLSCGNCHQIGSWRFRRAKTEEQWQSVLTRMMANLPPYFQDTRDSLVDTVIATYGPGATYPTLPVPPPPSGEVLKAVVYEYILGTATSSPGCHDLEVGADDRVYADAGLRWIDPRTSERGLYPFTGDSHSIEQGPDGNMWITQAGSDSLAEVFVDGVTPPAYFPLPNLGGVQGAYPHTNRFDSHGVMWTTLTKSNQLSSFDPSTAEFAYFPLPEADPAEVGLSIPVAYGCDVAPDDSVWWSQLFGQRIGRFVPATNAMKAWRPPFYGPRRLGADQDDIVWVPGYGSGVLGRFDPAIERWKVYPLPTGLAGPAGFGTSEMPYNLYVNRRNGQVWINGSNSDTMIRFEPGTERFTAFPLPTRASFTREIEFDADNHVWTCTGSEAPGPGERGQGKFVKIELPPRDAACGNGRLEAGEECDDGDTADCDGCTTRCRRETGCGDGAVCDDEVCDDGNRDDCDGCSGACAAETGLLCGDGVVNAACGEECDPPVAGRCTGECLREPGCGDGILDPGEGCDDGNTTDCDGCSAACRVETGCGDGVVCGAEQCDDGNATSCDGCSPACAIELGPQCGDGITNAACDEECDPPGAGPPACNYRCRLGPATPLGTRRFTFGGALYTSALGTGVPLGVPDGRFDLVGGAPDFDGQAAVTVAGPTYLRVPILGGSFGYFCARLTSCTGFAHCNGGTPAGVLLEQDSAGPGTQGNPIVVTTGLGDDGGPGTVLLTCGQSTVQVDPPAPDCSTVSYPPDVTTPYTTGAITGRLLNPYAQIGTAEISVAGETFDCAQWASEDGAGVLAGAFLQESAPQAGDVANALRLDD